MWLYPIPIRHIADVTVVTDVEEAGVGIVRCVTTVESPIQEEILLELCDAAGEIVAQGSGNEVELCVPDVHLWQPGDGYLYHLRITLTDADSDRLSTATRCPWVSAPCESKGHSSCSTANRSTFEGFGKHEDLNVHGRGHDDAAMVHDFSLLSWIGANSFRTSHYPYAEEVLELADRTGSSSSTKRRQSDSTSASEAGCTSVVPSRPTPRRPSASPRNSCTTGPSRSSIARDKNHPCVVLWSLANEPESHTEAARDLLRATLRRGPKRDPTRPVGFVNMMFALPTPARFTELADVVMVNRYYGWYIEPGDLEAAERGA